MALFVNQNGEDRSQLQQRIAAELQEKNRQKAAAGDRPDGVEDSQYLKDTRQGRPLATAIWIIVSAVAIVTLLAIIFMVVFR